MPEKVFKNLKSYIWPQWKICFFAAVIVGILAHFYKITNWLPNWDSLVFRYDAQNMTRLGRWFLSLVCSFSSFYDLPWINGLIAILFHALGAVCVCKLLNVKKGVTSALIGAVIVAFPTVTSVMMYNYVADGYAIAFFLACLAAVNLTKEKPRFVTSVILITLSVAIYQAYVEVTIMLILIHLIDELIYQKKSGSYLAKKAAKIMAAGATGIFLYYVILTVLVRLSGKALLDYQGVASTVSLSNINLRDSLFVCVYEFVEYFFDFSKGINTFNILNLIIFAVIVITYIIDAAKGKVFKSFQKTLLLAVFVLLLPVGASVLVFINSSIDHHNLMRMGYVVFYLFLIILYERGNVKNKRLLQLKSWTILALGCLLVFNQIIIANVSYHKLQIAYEKSYGTLIRIADRIEQTEGAENCSDILIIGALSGSKAYSVDLPPDMTGTTDSYILRADDEVVKQSVLCSAINDYCGKEYRFVSGERKREIIEKYKNENMKCWPHKTSIVVKDDIILIKLGEEGQ